MSDEALLISTRQRHVMTNANRMLLDRCAKMLNAEGLRMQLKCASPVCPDPIIVLRDDRRAERGAVLSCGCTDLEFSRV